MLVYHFDYWMLIGFAVQCVLPLAVNYVSTYVTPVSVQWILTSTLTALVSLGTQMLSAHSSGQPFDIFQAGLTAIAGILFSIGAHFALWKTTGVTDKVLNLRAHKFTPAPVPPALIK